MSFNAVDALGLAAVLQQRIHFNQRRPRVLDEHTEIDLINTEWAGGRGPCNAA